MPLLHRLGDSRLYHLPKSRFVFIFADRAEPTVPLVELGDSWGKGFYAFLAQVPETPAERRRVGQELWAQFSRLDPDPHLPRIGWRTGTGVLYHLLTWSPSSRPWLSVVKSDAALPIANMVLHAEHGCVVALVLGDEPRFEIRPDKAGRIWVTVHPQSDASGGERVAIEGIVSIPLFEPQGGAVRFDASFSPSALLALDVSIRYFFRASPTVYQSHAFPIFSSSPGETRLQIKFDFTAPADGSRSGIRFKTDAPLESHFRLVQGHRVSLKPLGDHQENPGRLVFQRQPGSPANPALSTYLVPAGSYELTLPKALASKELDFEYGLVCGIAGPEYILVRPGIEGRATPGDRLVFLPDQPAYFSTVGPFGLTDLVKTAWVSVARAKGIGANPAPLGYVSHPEEAVLYKPPTVDIRTPSASGFLYFSPVLFRQATVLPAVPMAPMAGVVGLVNALAPVDDLQKGVLSPERHDQIGALPPPSRRRPFTRTPSQRATQQGLIGEFDGEAWETVILTADPKREKAEGGHVRLVVTPELEDALLRDRVFLVATRFGEHNPIQFVPDGQDTGRTAFIRDWGFSVGDWGQPGKPDEKPILILKFDDRPLTELAKDLSLWTQPGRFNSNASATRALLLRRIEEARSAPADQQPHYREFREAVEDPYWNGILALHVELATSNLPVAIRALKSGMSGSFYARHFGVRVNRVSEAAGKLQLDENSLFALVDYQQLPVAPPDKNDYHFWVRYLKAHFSNSLLKDFRAELHLYVPKLFDEATDPTDIVIVGSYKLENGEDHYTFLTPRPYVIPFPTSAIIQTIQIDLVSFSAHERGNGVDARFAVEGTLEFQKISELGLSDIISLKSLNFTQMALEMAIETVGKPAPIRFEPGRIVVNIGVNSKRDNGFLSNFPVRLEGFRFAPGGVPFEKLGVFPVVNSGATFTFGLMFRLDLGSLGNLVSSSDGFSLGVLLGWGPGFKVPSVGLELPQSSGGKREFGIEGVLRVTMERFEFGTAEWPGHEDPLVALALRGCRVYLLGAPVPDQGEYDFYLFANPAQPEEGKVGWFFLYRKVGTTAGLRFLGLGQRVAPTQEAEEEHYPQLVELFEKGSLPTTESAGAPKIKFQSDSAVRYDPNRNWLMAGQFRLIDLLDVGVVFNDPALYLLFLGVGKAPNYAWSVEVAYRKVTEGLGVYSLDVGLPTEWRQIMLGPVAVTVPFIGIKVWTNGDWLVDIGFPVDLDFSRSFQAQAPPFVGWAGLYLGRLSGASSSLLPTLDPKYRVLQVGIAVRIGLGAELRQGILRAGLTVSVYGIIEGALAIDSTKKNPLAFLDPDEYALQGQWGIIGEIYGIIDFGILKCGVSVRVWAGIGIRIASGETPVVWIDAGVTCRAFIEINIKLIFKRIVIRIEFSFTTRIRKQWPLEKSRGSVALRDGTGSGSAALRAGTGSATPRAGIDCLELPVLRAATCCEQRRSPTGSRYISWDAKYQHRAVFGRADKQPLHLYFIPNATVVGGKFHLIATLAVENGPPDRLVDEKSSLLPLLEAVGGWMLFRYLHFLKRGVPEKDLLEQTFTKEELECLSEVLHRPPTLARQMEGDIPLNYETLATFLGENCDARLRGNEGADEKPIISRYAYFPAMPELIIIPGKADKIKLSDFKVSLQHQEKISQFFSELFIQFKANENRGRDRLTDCYPRVEVLFQDYFDALVKRLADLYWEWAIEYERKHPGNRISIKELLKMTRTQDKVGEVLTRFFLHGLRLPDDLAMDQVCAPKVAPAPALYAFTGQQFPVATDGKNPLTVSLELDQAAKPWYQLGTPLPSVLLGETASQTIEQHLPAPAPPSVDLLPYLKPRPKSFPFQQKLVWKEVATVHSLFPFPQRLVDELSRPQHPGLRLQLRTRPASSPFGKPSDVKQLSGTVVSLVQMLVKRVPSARGSGVELQERQYLPHVYEVVGASELDGRRLNDLARLDGSRFEKLQLLYSAGKDVPGLVSDGVAPVDLRIVQTNLSTESNPPPPSLRRFNEREAQQFSASADEIAVFVDLLRQCGIVNSGGYHLYYRPKDVMRSLIPEGEESARVTFLFEFKADTLVRPYHNAVLFKKEDVEQDKLVVYAEVDPANQPHELDYDVAIEPGCVGFLATRANSPTRYRVPRALAKKATLRGDITREQLVALLDRHSEIVGKRNSVSWERALVEGGDGKAFLEKTYHLVAYYVRKSDFFKPSDQTLPVGPRPATKDPKWEDDPDVPSDQIDETLWRYKQVFPAYRYQVNPPKPLPNGTCATSPYGVVGKTIAFDFRYRDMFGNEIDAGGDSKTFPIRHTDRILPLNEWPALGAEFWVEPTTGQPQLQIRLRFKQDPFVEGAEARTRAAEALKVYERAYFQITAPDTHLWVATSLVDRTPPPTAPPAEPGAPRPGRFVVDASKLYEGLIKRVMEFLWPIAHGTPGQKGEIVYPLTFEFTAPPETSPDVFPVTVDFGIQRLRKSVDTQFWAEKAPVPIYPPAAYAVTAIPSSASQADRGARLATDPPHSLEELARRFEIALPRLKLATGLANAAGPGLFAVGRRLLEISVDNGGKQFHAPIPVWNHLWSGSASVPQKAGRDVTEQFKSVDLDNWMRDLLETVEWVLGPERAIPLERVDLVTPESRYFDQLMQAKGKIARQLACLVQPLFKYEAAGSSASAREVFRQRVLDDLNAAYEVGGIAEFPAMVPMYQGSDQVPPRLYGKVRRKAARGVAGSPAPDDDSTLSTARVPLPQGSGEQGPTQITFLYDAKRVPASTLLCSGGRDRKRAETVLDLELTVTQLEYDRQKPVESGTVDCHEERDEYLYSSWLNFIQPETIPMGKSPLPVPLRQHPDAPVTTAQSWRSGATPASPEWGARTDRALQTSLKEIRAWHYRLEFEAAMAPQDTLIVHALYNERPPDFKLASAASVPLPEALARFRRVILEGGVREALLRLLPEALEAIEKGQASPAIQEAEKLIAQLVSHAQAVATADWEGWKAQRQRAGHGGDGPPVWEDVYRAQSNTEKPERTLCIHWQKPKSGKPCLPMARFLELLPLDCETSQSTPVYSEHGTSFEIKYTCSENPPGRRAKRALTLGRLDMFIAENAVAELSIERNADLLSTLETADAFVYRTAGVRFPNPETPLVRENRPLYIDELAGSPAQDTAAAHLSRFFKTLFADAPDGAYRLQTRADFGFHLRSAADDEVFIAYLPKELALPSEFNWPGDATADRTGKTYVERLARAVDHAMKENLANEGFFNFQIKVFARLQESGRVLLEMTNVRLRIKSIRSVDG